MEIWLGPPDLILTDVVMPQVSGQPTTGIVNPRPL